MRIQHAQFDLEGEEDGEKKEKFIGSGPGPVRDFGTERALAEPLDPNTGNFPNSSTRFTLLTELNLSLKARPEAHTFDFGSDQEPVRDEGAERALVEPLGPNTGNFQNIRPCFTLLTELNQAFV